MEPIIAIKNLIIKYGDYTVIDDINLEVMRGEIVTLFGPSGCGKSTILKTALGMLIPHSGSITINGIEASQYDKPLAYAPQFNELLPWKSVLQNVTLWHDESRKKFQNHDGIQPRSAVEYVELTEASYKLPKQLSGGMERRAALARCISTNSDIMFFDEAFISVERRLRRKLMHTLRKHIKEKAITVISISHDFEEATYMSDRVIVLTANPTIIEKEIKIQLPVNREISLFDTKEFIDQSIQIIH